MSMVEAVASGLVNGNGFVDSQKRGNVFQLNEAPAAWYSTMLLKSKKMEAVAVPPPYVQSRLKRSTNFLSQESLEMCTECLVSETGSDGFLDIEEMVKQVEMDRALSDRSDVFNDVIGKKELSTGVNYHSSYTTNKFFPPPLPSISRRDGRCVLMKPQRKDGHLILNTTLAPSKNYLHCQREGGHLQLSFVETTFKEIYHEIEDPVVTRQRHAAEEVNQPEPVAEAEEEEDEEEYEEEEEEEMAGMEVEEEEDDEEEVEVVNRGNVVEVKVSCLPQVLTGGMKVHRSSLVINKFVGMPLDSTPMAMETPVVNVEPSNTDTTAQTMAEVDRWGRGKNSPTRSPADSKLLFSSKKMMNRQALLHQVRRCGEYNRPLFFWEHCCIAT